MMRSSRYPVLQEAQRTLSNTGSDWNGQQSRDATKTLSQVQRLRWEMMAKTTITSLDPPARDGVFDEQEGWLEGQSLTQDE